jgi:uncharacterized peroxidase-related enzyme
MNHHGAGLRTLLGSGELPRALVRDYRKASISVADLAMLDYAVGLTLAPSAVDGQDVAALRAAGFDDAAVLDVCQVTSYYNYVNRLADGLGVEMEDFWTRDELTITPEEFQARLAGKGAAGTG